MNATPSSQPTRDDLATEYLTRLQYAPYPVQEEALLAWFTSSQGVLVCAPTGTGKTLIAEAALFEALHTGQVAYYTTPLIALTEQKFREMQERAVAWGFSPTDIGLVTGNRRENPQARILVVVAEILLNRLLHRGAFDFDHVESVVMDEFHNFNDPERGVVWELTLGMLPSHVRTLLLSATVGNAFEFTSWLARNHDRKLQLVESTDRKVPLTYQWVGDQLLNEQLIRMAAGDETSRSTPALVFCFNREECWNVAEQLKGKQLIDSERQQQLTEELKQYDWSEGVGPKLRQILLRGVGVHHAGVLPKYRRIVEALFQRKMLSVTVCTETLAAGVNLPARSVILPMLMKGPPDKKKLIDASTAHQIFGRAGRPQFDDRGFVIVLAAEDDVKIARWKEKLGQIPEDTKDPGLLKAKKALKKKMPKRRSNFQYWTESQFEKLRDASPRKLFSTGALPWRLLAHLLEASPEVQPLRHLVGKRLMDTGGLAKAQRQLDRMLITLWRAGYVTLQPRPPLQSEVSPALSDPSATASNRDSTSNPRPTLFGMALDPSAEVASSEAAFQLSKDPPPCPGESPAPPQYQPEFAHPTDELYKLSQFRSVNPVYGVFLVNHLGIANRDERLQALESVLEMPGAVARFVRVPDVDELPPGPLATGRLDEQLLRYGLVSVEELTPQQGEREFDPHQRPPPPLTLSRKLRMLFDYDFPGFEDLRTQSVWVAGELLQFEGNFNKFILSRRLQKQEGIIFRHLLRLILLLGEFAQLCPPDTTADLWRSDLENMKAAITESCRRIDPKSTEKVLESAVTLDDEPEE